MNIGQRCEFERALTERFDRSVRGFDYNYVQPFQTANYPRRIELAFF